MLKAIDDLLNRVTMYKLVLYSLIFLLFIAAGLGAFGLLPYSPVYLAFSVMVLFLLSVAGNRLFAAAFKAPYNAESTWITALILALIISPPASFGDAHYLMLAFWASLWAVASKYILAIKKKHIFNPAAFGVAITGLALGLPATWWVGTKAMVPFVLAAGLLIVRKIRRFDLWVAFLAAFLLGGTYFLISTGKGLAIGLEQSLLYSPLFFFSTIMLTEPLTTPPTRLRRIIYGALVGFLFLPNLHFGVIYLTPELALLIGNLYAYLASSKDKLILTLKGTRRLSPDVLEFAFVGANGFSFVPGQYMEWTLPHERPDLRGTRRYFTIASSPTERDLKLGVKFYGKSSSYKQEMLALRPGDKIIASQLSGDFMMPKDKGEKLVFIAGGIGGTPFRSMVQNLLDRKEKRPITILYQNKAKEDAVYREIFKAAESGLGVKYVELYARLDEEVLKREVPDYLESTFFISGPQALVTSYKELLLGLGVSRSRIKTDYFPGF